MTQSHRADGKLRGAPIALQIFALLAAALVVAQASNLAVVLLLPPPQAPVYRFAEIAAAVHGRSLSTRFGRQLIRTVGPAPDLTGRPAAWGARELAALLTLPLNRVRFQVEAVPPWAPLPGGAPPVGGPLPPLPRPGLPPSRSGFDPPLDPAQRTIVGGFLAAVRQPTGSWIVVRPTPVPFPNEWQFRIILVFAGCLAAFSLMGFLFARRMTAPIRAFASAAERLGRDPRAPLLTLKGPAELGVAARAFNAMQVRIKRYVEDRTGMVGAISHDLRTPLMRIRFKLEGASPTLRATVLDDVRQMEEMVADVLLFIRDDNAPTKRERLDLLSVLECEVDAAALVGADAAMREAEPLVVVADPVSLRRLFANLIDNAVKYGRRARVSLRAEGGEAVAEVIDEGPGLPADELERVFEPFYRHDPSRNRGTGGVGLGLSVARSIARAHGGDLTLARWANGLVAVVRLPLSAE